MNIQKNIPTDLLHIILEYDGRIKYKNGQYTNIIHQKDERYDMIKPLINKKMEIMKKIQLDLYNSKPSFYFEFGFDIDLRVGLCYDYNFTFPNEFEICYYDTRNGWDQIKTYI